MDFNKSFFYEKTNSSSNDLKIAHCVCADLEIYKACNSLFLGSQDV